MRKTKQRKLRAEFKKATGRLPRKMTVVSEETGAYLPSEWRRLKKGRA